MRLQCRRARTGLAVAEELKILTGDYVKYTRNLTARVSG